jgi:uncharacterized protein (DUF58 family)
MAKGFFGRLVPTLLAAVALLGAHDHQLSVVALATTLLFILLVTRFWSSHSLHAVEYHRATPEDRAFPGDELLLTLRLANHKLLPLPWVEVDDWIPPALLPIQGEGEEPAPREKGWLRLGGSIGWHGRLRWRYRLRCLQRGIYRLGPATITSGDPFGLFPRSRREEGTGRVVVYPRLLPLEQLGLPAGFPLGEGKPEKWIFHDPSRPVGVRDYRREDPFRHIHWKATARRLQLQVKLHEPTTTLETAIFLGMDTFGRPSTPTFEHAVSVAATLAYRLIGQRHPVGLYLNGGSPDSMGSTELAPAASQEQLVQILELLAGVEPVAGDPIELLLERVARRLPWGASVVLVVGSLSEPLATELEGLRRTGRKPVLFLIGADAPPRAPEGVILCRLQPEPTEAATGAMLHAMASRTQE